MRSHVENFWKQEEVRDRNEIMKLVIFQSNWERFDQNNNAIDLDLLQNIEMCNNWGNGYEW